MPLKYFHCVTHLNFKSPEAADSESF